MRQIGGRELRRIRTVTYWLVGHSTPPDLIGADDASQPCLLQLFQFALSATLVGLIIRHLETKTHVPSYYRSVGWFSFGGHLVVLCPRYGMLTLPSMTLIVG